MFKIVDQISDETCKHVVKLVEFLHICHVHQVMHALKRIYDMSLVVVWVVMEVPISNLERVLSKFLTSVVRLRRRSREK